MSLVLLLALASDPPTPPVEDPSGDETIVTARKQAESLERVPLSATALSPGEIEDYGLREVSDLASRVPNVVFSEFSARRLSFPFVRGVGSGIEDPAVITYVDDVPQFGFGGTNLPLFALERVEFLRGPQGTLYGKSALGGLIHVRGRRPGDASACGLGATFGSDDLREYSASYAGPVGAGVLADVALLDSERDGYTTNDFTGNEVDDRDGLFGRGRFRWNPGPDSELDLAFFGEHARDGGFALSDLSGLRANPHHIDQDFEGVTERDVYQPSLVWRAACDELDFTSISAYQAWDVLETSDFDFSPFDVVRRRSDEEQRYVYQELRLGTSVDTPVEGGAPRRFSWLVGGSGFLGDAERSAANTFSALAPPPLVPGTDRTQGEFDDLGLAVFGQVSLPVGEELELTGGLRYDREEKEVERAHTFDAGGGPMPVPGPGDGDETFDEVLPMAGLSWHCGADALVYVRAAKGFKAGGFNLSAPAGKEEFEAETAWSYELGWRRSFADERYSLGATAFFVDWDDMQLAQFDPMAGGFVDNAGESESQGVELEGRAALADWIDGLATFGLLDTEIEEFTDSFGTDTSGNELPFAPDSTWSLGFDTHGELAGGARWSLAGDYTRIGSFFYDAGNREGDDFGLANLRLGLDSERYGAALWVRNLFDEEYEPVAFQPNPGNPFAFVGESGAPRVLGFSLSVHL
jgi:iron complex outermembrane receptor protein